MGAPGAGYDKQLSFPGHTFAGIDPKPLNVNDPVRVSERRQGVVN